MIHREDMAIEDHSIPGGPVNQITLPHLTGFVFGPDLRKPHFQRETNQWTPKKVAELITAFVDRDLIPAVILWRAGKYIFVVDGAHRLSALLAWIHNDYGDGDHSKKYFGPVIALEQVKVAKRTRDLVNKFVGSYSSFEEARKNPAVLEGKPDAFKARVARMQDLELVAQWVPTADSQAAEDSYFSINQLATPIDPTEIRILKARQSASAIAARAITNGGTGHRYWSRFGKVVQAEIEELGQSIYTALFQPPISSTPLNTLDVPVAGKGYNVLPFVFDLVNMANKVQVADTTKKKTTKDQLPEDPNGETTLEYMRTVQKLVGKITTDKPGSLGLHPVVYFYTNSGAFKSESFFAASNFFQNLDENGKLKKFHEIRASFEDILVDHKVAIAQIVHRFGTGTRSIPWLQNFYERIVEKLFSGMDGFGAYNALQTEDDFKFLFVPPPAPHQKSSKSGKKPFGHGVQTAAYFAQALPGCVRCKICSSRVHKNSMHIDHKIDQKLGGGANVQNAQVTHPYCDSSKG